MIDGLSLIILILCRYNWPILQMKTSAFACNTNMAYVSLLTNTYGSVAYVNGTYSSLNNKIVKGIPAMIWIAMFEQMTFTQDLIYNNICVNVVDVYTKEIAFV